MDSLIYYFVLFVLAPVSLIAVPILMGASQYKLLKLYNKKYSWILIVGLIAMLAIHSVVFIYISLFKIWLLLCIVCCAVGILVYVHNQYFTKKKTLPKTK